MWKQFTTVALALAFVFLLRSPSYALEIGDFKANPIPVKTFCLKLTHLQDIRRAFREEEHKVIVMLVGVYLQLGYCVISDDYFPMTVTNITERQEPISAIEVKGGFIVEGTVEKSDDTKVTVWTFLNDAYLRQLVDTAI